jgi:hypothetical protein
MLGTTGKGQSKQRECDEWCVVFHIHKSNNELT